MLQSIGTMIGTLGPIYYIWLRSYYLVYDLGLDYRKQITYRDVYRVKCSSNLSNVLPTLCYL